MKDKLNYQNMEKALDKIVKKVLTDIFKKEPTAAEYERISYVLDPRTKENADIYLDNVLIGNLGVKFNPVAGQGEAVFLVRTDLPDFDPNHKAPQSPIG